MLQTRPVRDTNLTDSIRRNTWKREVGEESILESEQKIMLVELTCRQNQSQSQREPSGSKEREKTPAFLPSYPSGPSNSHLPTRQAGIAS